MSRFSSRMGLVSVIPTQPHKNVAPLSKTSQRWDSVSSRSLGKVENKSLAERIRKHGIFKVAAAIQSRIAPVVRKASR